MLKNVRFTLQFEETFLIGHRAGRDSAKTYEFSARGACAEKRMTFPVLSEASLIGGLMAFPEKDRVDDTARRPPDARCTALSSGIRSPKGELFDTLRDQPMTDKPDGKRWEDPQVVR